MTLNQLTIKEATAGIEEKKFSVRELVSDCLRAIKKENGALNAYLEVFDDALDEAGRLDKIRSDTAELPPLFGIPLAIKDNILIKGKRTTAGSKILEPYCAAYDATAIEKLRSRGALFLGKTNLDEFAMGSSTEHSAFGPTKNPHDPRRVPGGSSGGSTAAVAANLCLGALGSDTGGSIRQPASFCGIVGLKPTYGAVSRHGLIAMASSLDQIGPLAKTVDDAAILFHAIAGKDPFDATAQYDAPDVDTAQKNLKGLHVGIPVEYFEEGIDPEVERIIKTAVKKIEEAGAVIQEIILPYSSFALPCYYIIVASEISANMARFDGIRYGLRAKDADTLLDVYTRTRAQGLGDEVKRRIMLGTYALSAGYYDAYYLKAQQVRRLIRNDFAQAFKKVDVIAGPATPTPAFRFGERSDDPLQMYLADVYTVALNLAGVPGLALPAGFVEKENARLPVGLQLIAPWFKENALLQAGTCIEKILSSIFHE